jgi:hypothetical protein
VMMVVMCPPNSKVGHPLTVTYNGRKFSFSVPAGVEPGQQFRVAFPPSANLRPLEVLRVMWHLPHSLPNWDMIVGHNSGSLVVCVLGFWLCNA